MDRESPEFVPTVAPYGRQIFVCTNGNCADPDQARSLLSSLRQLNRRQGRDRLSDPERIHCTSCGCLGVCAAGPVMIVYPEGIWYHHVDRQKLVRIYEEHLLEGKPVDEYILHRHFPAGREPDYAPDLRQHSPPDPLQAAAERSARDAEAARQAAGESVPPNVQAARERRRRRRANRSEQSNDREDA